MAGLGGKVVAGTPRDSLHLAAVDLSEIGLTGTVELAASAEGRLTTHVLNVTARAAAEKLPSEVAAAHGPIDGMLNVAGIAKRSAHVQDLSFDEIERVVAVNFWGVVNMTKVFLPVLLERPESCLVNVSSMGAWSGSRERVWTARAKPRSSC